MNTIQLIIRAFSMVPDYYVSHKVPCIIILGINLLGVLAGIINTFRRSRFIRGPRAFLYIFFRVLLLFGALTFGIMLLLASEVAEASPEQFSFGFYIEIIVAGIILAVFLYRKVNEESSSEEESDFSDPVKEQEDAAKAFVKTFAVIILSVIFMIFGNGMIRWGFSLFGKKVGAWFFGLYAGWAVGIIFDLLQEVTDLLNSALISTIDEIPTEKLPGHKGGASNGNASSSTIPTGTPATGKPATGKPATGKPTTGKPAIGKPATGKPTTGKPAGSKSPRGRSSGFKDGLLSFLKQAAIFFLAFVILNLGAVVANRIMYPAPKMPADHVMVWNDSVLESKMREVTGIYSGDIRLKDVWNITELDLGRSYADNESAPVSNLQALSELKNLRKLSIVNSAISDISALAGLTSLEHLILDYNQISDISPLAGLTSLYELSLWNNQIGDVSPLADLTSLHYLHLSNNQISDISPLARLTSLRTISMSDNMIPDISVLANFKELDRLIMENNQITSVAPLQGLKNLSCVYASGNPLTDAYILQDMDIAELYL